MHNIHERDFFQYFEKELVTDFPSTLTLNRYEHPAL